MSELKARSIIGLDERCNRVENYYYLKSEADKVIAGLEETLKNSRNAHTYWRKEYLIEHKECLYQKYKRCLGMARLSLEKRETYVAEREEWCLKWYKRWLELAEIFKPNNEVNNA